MKERLRRIHLHQAITNPGNLKKKLAGSNQKAKSQGKKPNKPQTA